MKNKWKILKRTLILALAFCVLNLFQGCMTYNLAEKDVNQASLYAKYANENKYFILYNVTGVYHLSDIQIINETISAAVSPVDAYHVPYLIMAGEDSPVLAMKNRNADVDSEVILYTQLEIPDDAKSVMIPLSSVQKMNTYKWGLKGGAVLGIIAGAFLIFLVILGTIISPFQMPDP
jgi:hypothetical protein